MLRLSDRFKLDVVDSGYNFDSLIPMISFQYGLYYYISCFEGLIEASEGTYDWKFVNDLDLRVSSIRESINIHNRNFKTGNVNISFHNKAPREAGHPDGTGEVFADVSEITQPGEFSFSDFSIEQASSFINTEVRVFYTSPKYTLEESLLVYVGTVKSIDHDSTRVNIVLEDATLDKLDKKVPYANTGFSNQVFHERFKNTPIPMVYGEVDKAPALVLSEPSNSSAEKFDFIIADDFFSEERDINIQHIGRLYLYNDDYYEVLPDFNNDVIGDVEGVEDWQWTNTQQWTSVGNYVAVPRIYQGAFPMNPPAFNELQCIKQRTPSYLANMGNPVGVGYTVDDQNHPVQNIETTIYNPELAVDSDDFMNEYFSSGINVEQNYYSTYAEIPDPTALPPDVQGDLVFIDQFIPHKEADFNHGIYNNSNYPEYQEFYPSSYQYEVQSWLTRNMNVFNDDVENPTAVYIEMPTAGMIQEAVRQRIIADFGIANQDADVTMAGGSGSGHRNKMTSYINVCANHIADWCTQSGIASDYYYERDESDSVMFEAQQFLSGYTNGLDSVQMTAVREGSTWATNPDHDSILYPQATYYRFLLHNNHRRPVGTGEGVGASFVCVSQMNASMSEGHYHNTTSDSSSSYGSVADPSNLTESELAAISPYPNGGSGSASQEDAIYYNIFNDGTDTPYLFEPEDFAQYTPWSLIWKGHVDQYERMCRIIYSVAWNGVASGANITSSWIANDMENKYFGIWHRNDYVDRANEWDMYIGAQDSWAIWVKQEIDHVGGDELQLNDNPADNPNIDNFYPEGTIAHNSKVKIPANTIIPCKHKAQKKAGDSYVEWTGRDFDIGGISTTVDGYITLNDGHVDHGTNDKRLNLAFPLRELNISNEIKTDSFFQGKFEISFDTENTADISTASFIAAVGAVDTKGEGLDEGFDWNTLDQDRNELVSETLSSCNDLGQILFSTYEADLGLPNNIYDGDFSGLRISQFHTTDNYNAINLTFRVDNTIDSDELINEIASFNLKIYNASIIHYTQFEKALESDFYMEVSGRIPTEDDIITIPNFNYGEPLYKYTFEDAPDSNPKLIEMPTDIMYHILEKEANIIDSVDFTSLMWARNYPLTSTESYPQRFAFSINEEINIKSLFEELSKSTNIIPRFKNTSKFGFIVLKQGYSGMDNYSHDLPDFDRFGEIFPTIMIKNKDIISYSHSRTPLSEVHTLVNVKYKYDYATGEYLKETGYIDGYDCFGNGDSFFRYALGFDGYSYDKIGLDREDKVLEFESKYIRDRYSAKALRDFLYLWNCNQHTKINITLPLKYIYLEVGDIVGFDELIDGSRAYGEDYTTFNTRNMQTIYPYFLVESCTKSEKNIVLRLIQLHKSVRDFTPLIGSVSRSVGVGDNIEGVEMVVDGIDIEELEDFLLGENKYFTSEQKRVSDLDDSGYINEKDLEDLEAIIPPDIDNAAGDVNLDGVVNVIDIVALVNNIIDDGAFSEALDVTGDGVVNILDIVALVNLILGTQQE